MMSQFKKCVLVLIIMGITLAIVSPIHHSSYYDIKISLKTLNIYRNDKTCLSANSEKFVFLN